MSKKTPLKRLGLSARAFNALTREGIHSVELLAECTPRELLDFRNFGEVSLAEVESALAACGLTLAAYPLPAQDTYVPESRRRGG